MDDRSLVKLLLLLSIAVALAAQGCTYAISPGLARQAEKNVSFEKLQNNPETYAGKLFILGGTIASVQELRQGTLLEVTQTPLDYWGKPQRTHNTGGRFLVFTPGRLNPFAYIPGRVVTVAGELLAADNPLFAEKQYASVVIQSKEIKLWAQDRQTGGLPQWTDPLYDPDSPARRD